MAIQFGISLAENFSLVGDGIATSYKLDVSVLNQNTQAATAIIFSDPTIVNGNNQITVPITRNGTGRVAVLVFSAPLTVGNHITNIVVLYPDRG